MSTITLSEKWESGTLGAFDADFTAVLSGTDDYVTALVEAMAQVPLTFFNGTYLLYRVNVKLSERLSEEDWKVSIQYGTAQQQQQNQEQFATESAFNQQFEIGGGTARITHSKQTIQKYTSAGAGTGADFGKAINVTETGVEGVDIIVPNFSFSETRNFLAEEMASLRALLFTMVGKTNSTTFMGFAAGEVLYAGASGGLKGGNTFGEVTHKFSASPNATGLSVGAITGIAKKGHEYLWVRSKETIDAGTGTVVLTPYQANVERVYASADLNNIPYINDFGA